MLRRRPSFLFIWVSKPQFYLVVLIATILYLSFDPSLAPKGHRILHIFTTAGVEDWEYLLMLIILLRFHPCHGLSKKAYEQKKELVANEITGRLEKKLFPGLQDSIVLKESKEVIEFSKQIKEKMKEIDTFDGWHNQKSNLDWRISSC